MRNGYNDQDDDAKSYMFGKTRTVEVPTHTYPDFLTFSDEEQGSSSVPGRHRVDEERLAHPHGRSPPPAPAPLPPEHSRGRGHAHYKYPEVDSDFTGSSVESTSSLEILVEPAIQPVHRSSRTTAKRSRPPTRPAASQQELVIRKREPKTLEDMMDEIKALRDENDRLREKKDEPTVPTQPAVLAYTSRVFHQLDRTLYLDQPHWEPTEGNNVVLLANNPIRNIDYYLDQHPEIAFAIYKEYNTSPPADHSKIETKDGVYRTPTPSHEFISLISPAMLDATEDFIEKVPGFGDYFPYFNPESHILAPYLFMYYSMPFADEILPELDLTAQNLIKQLQTAINKSHGYEYESAKMQAEKGLVSRHLLKYLVRPGDVLIGGSRDQTQAYISMGWIESPEAIVEDAQYEPWDNARRKRIPRYGPLAKSAGSKKRTTYSWTVPAWCWQYDGSFAKHEVNLEIYMDVGYDEETVKITSLNIYPLNHAPKEIRLLLEKRGKTFWSMRYRRFVSYMRSEDEELYNVKKRETYT
jgi:hypothetical protein